MPSFSGGNASFTPSTTNDNWTLDFGVTGGTFGKVVSFAWGGSLTTSTGYRTRWTRPTAAGGGARTLLTLGAGQPNYPTPGGALVSTYGSSQPTLASDPAANLFREDWNAQGGGGYVALPPNSPWWVVSGVLNSAISCRNLVGTDANGSSYHVTWEE
ncbi:MAG: hypothetical protein KGO96_10650 [Elusimicrobia bacterium]|nr:hypothetical protein [Elusimicrobiota bacterium]